MENQEIDIAVRKWLGSDEGQAVLDKVARAVSASARSNRLSMAFLTRDALGNYASDDLIEDVKSELALFIMEKGVRLSPVLTSENRNPHPFLRQAFINHWIAKTRIGGKDPRRAFYKRVQDVLRNAEGIHRLTEPQRALRFSLVPQNRSHPRLCEEDIISIPFPDDLPQQYESVNKKDILLRLARHFWQEVSGMWEGLPLWVDIRDLLNWIEQHISIEAPITHKEDLSGKSVMDNLPDDAENRDVLCYDRDSIIAWAGHYSKRMSKKEGDVFRLTHDAGLNLREVAEKLGYKGSSGPKYILEGINEKLRFFLRDLPWLSPDDLCQEAFSLFMDTLILNLKKAPPTP